MTKRELLERILVAWAKAPDLRLGQFLDNAVYMHSDRKASDLFYASDEEIVKAVEWFVGRNSKS